MKNIKKFIKKFKEEKSFRFGIIWLLSAFMAIIPWGYLLQYPLNIVGLIVQIIGLIIMIVNFKINKIKFY
jgi:uncharacterized membrane protein